MPSPIRAILWAQAKTLSRFRRGRGGLASSAVAGLLLLLWYGAWGAAAVAAGLFASRPANTGLVETYLPRGLMFVTLYWQLAPLVFASMGFSLDLKKLMVYPIQPAQLFGAGVALRLSTCMEMLLLVMGVAAGLVGNPQVAGQAAAAALFLFVVFNLLLASGLRDQIERLTAHRRWRELFVILLVTAAALPQLLVATGVPALLDGWRLALSGLWWPWSAAARAAVGHGSPAVWSVLLSWAAGAWFFGRWQFARSLRFDETAAGAGDRASTRTARRLDAVYRLPSRLLPDPLAAIVEKELRSLARSPRFRLLFIMGFTFGIMVFMPLFLGKGRSEGGFASSYALTLICGYSLLLLGDVVFWNIFGHDRAAVQLYFLEPLPFSSVLAGKNLAAVVVVLFEITAIVLVWTLLRLPIDAGKVAEAYAAPLVFCVYLLATGNLASIYYARPANPARTMEVGSSGRTRVLLVLTYPVLAIPVALAYGLRYIVGGQAVFYGVLAFAAVLGGAYYWISMGTAVAKAEERKEMLLAALSHGEGPIRLV